MDHLCGYLFTLFSDRFNGWLTRFLQIGWKRAMALSLSLMLWLGSTPSRSGLDANAISSEKINQFVRAYLQVVGLIEQRESDLQSTETESEFLQMQREVQAQALELIEAEGLTLQEYLQLLSLANIDPEFSERVAAQLQEAAELL
jgi:hypothetical protein